MTDQNGITVIFSTLVILLLLCSVIISVFIANRRHISQEVKIARMEADYEKELRIAEHEVQERVMANVARELHDNVGQRLTVLKMHVERHKIIHKDIREEIEPITADIDTTIGELRQISRSLNSDFLENGGMITAMQDEIERIRKLNTYIIHWTAEEEPALEKDQRVMVFRIFQETLNNILKHAKGKNIYITLQGGSSFMLEVRDDGLGFDVATKMATGNGAGLNNMIKRAAIANIKGTIESAEGKGTICRFTQV
jgi:signal transduction histidine kinase